MFNSSARSVRPCASPVRRNLPSGRFGLLEQLEARTLLSVPTNFVEQEITGSLAAAVSMAVAPDGRIFVAEQAGRVRVIKDDVLLSTPFFTTPNTRNVGEAGLLGIAFDPNFTTNGYVYLHYSSSVPTNHNRIVRVTADGDVADPASLVEIFALDPFDDDYHHGGAMHFGPDGKLYITTGDDHTPGYSQDLTNLRGKILRLNPDGSIPDDNPFVDNAAVTGKNKAIYAYGLRNPSTFAFSSDGTLFINDVGEGTWEEINLGVAGANYGWPLIEGERTTQPAPADYEDPIYAYRHDFSSSHFRCAITAGTFYTPPTGQFPIDYNGQYFYADFCGGVIEVYDPVNGTVKDFASNYNNIVDLRVAPDGSLLVLDRRSFIDQGNNGRLVRIRYTGQIAPVIHTQPQSQTVARGASVSFHVQASGSPAPTYQWMRDGVDIPGATGTTLTLDSVDADDDGAVFRVRVSNGIGAPVLSNPATLTVDDNDAPTATITLPASDTTWAGGQTISFAGAGADPQDGDLPASAFEWRVDFHHDQHFHDFLPSIPGVTSGQFTIPTTGELSPNVWYRIHLTVTDSKGAKHSTFTDIHPRRATMSLRANHPGLTLLMDGQTTATPADVLGVVGIDRTLEAPLTQTINNTVYEFTGWSDGGPRVRAFSFPEDDVTLTANYRISEVQPTYLSDLDWVSASSPYSGIKKDASSGGVAPLRIGGVTYAKGLGVHSPSDVVYNLGGQYTLFTAVVGIDDSVGNGSIDGSAQFLVYVDGVLRKTSSRLTGAMGSEFIEVDVTGAQTLRLVTTTGGNPGDNDYKDHADWADAKLYSTPAIPKPTITVTAQPAQVDENATTARGAFVISRTEPTDEDLIVNFTIGGTAGSGDYASIGTSVTIPAGEDSATVFVDPIDDSVFEGNETVVLTLAAHSAYVVGPSSSATVTIVEDDAEPVLPMVTVAATDAAAAETASGQTANTGTFTLTRTGDTTDPLVVSFTLTGTATNGSDYTAVPLTATIPAGQSSTTVTISPIDDSVFEGNETAVLTLTANASYLVGASASATVTIADNDPAPVEEFIYLSSLNWVSASSPYSGIKKDASSGGVTPLSIGGVMYARGLGVHSPSDVVYNLGGQYTRFTAFVGIDDCVGNGSIDGSAQFLVYVDGVLKKTSSRLTGATGAEFIDVDISGAQTLRLVTTTGGNPGDNDYKDHADWADAKLYFTPAPPPEPIPVGQGLVAEYFDNADFTSPVLTRVDAQLNMTAANWSLPMASGDSFSVRWRALLEAPETGQYILRLDSNQGARVWVNGQLIIDGWEAAKSGDTAIVGASGTVNLVAGEKVGLLVEYYELVGDQHIALSWQKPSGASEVIPSSAFSTPAEPSGQPLRIMTVGDSITEGEKDHASYRFWLDRALVSAGIHYDLVGSRSGVHNSLVGGDNVQPIYPWFDQDHQAQWGATLDEVAAFTTPAADIALIQIGHNDIQGGQSPQSLIDELSAYIDQLRAINPNIRIALAQPVKNTSLGFVDEMDAYRALLPDLAASESTEASPVIVVDQYTGFEPDEHTYDTVHPNEAGEKLIAQRFFEAIRTLLAM